MLVKCLSGCNTFKGVDGTMIRELLHPKNDGVSLPCSLAYASLSPQTSSHPHCLQATEMYFILTGTGRMHINNESKMLSKGCVVYIPPNARQYIENTGEEELSFLCIVAPPWSKEKEEVLKDS